MAILMKRCFLPIGGRGMEKSGGVCTCSLTLFIYQARESGVPLVKFLTAHFLQKTLFMRPFFYGGKRGLLLYIAFGEKMESVENLGRKKNKLVSTFTLIHASNANNPHPNCPIKTKA